MLQRVNFNPLRPRGRRLLIFHMAVAVLSFSTHSAHEDGDLMVKLSLKYNKRFQPTPPTRTETRGAKIPLYPFRYFNPLRPRGRRPAAMPTTHSIPRFQPTPPTRTETAILHKNQQFFITFPQSNHIIPPQITANLPCTHPKPFSLCSFSGANPP